MRLSTAVPALSSASVVPDPRPSVMPDRAAARMSSPTRNGLPRLASATAWQNDGSGGVSRVERTSWATPSSESGDGLTCRPGRIGEQPAEQVGLRSGRCRRPRADDHGDRKLVDAAGEIRQEAQRRRVEPVRVVADQGERARPRPHWP